MKSKKCLIFGLAIVLLIAFAATGCAPARRPIGDPQAPNMNQNNTMNTPGVERAPGNLDNDNLMDDNIIRNNEADVSMNRQLEQRIATEVQDINGVNNAVVIVNGNTAYIGIDAGRNLTGQRTNDLKEQVIDKARRIDTRITRVYVSADMDVTERLRGFGRNIGTGRPVTGFVNEIEELFRRPLPTT